MDSLPVYAINLYQRKISPLKGYRCAHHAMHGGVSCSEWMKQKTIEIGFIKALFLMKSRFYECKLASDEYRNIVVSESNKSEEDDSGDSKLDKEDVKDTVGCCLAGFPW